MKISAVISFLQDKRRIKTCDINHTCRRCSSQCKSNSNYTYFNLYYGTL